MIKDIVVNLSVTAVRDVAADYAVSVARMFEAHLAAVSFAYEPMIVGSVFNGAVAQMVAAQHAESKRAAQTAVANFSEKAQRNGVQHESRLTDVSVDGAAIMFATIARRFDMAVVAQAAPDKPGPEQQIMEATLFDSGRPMIVVPYIQTQEIKLDRVLVCWDGSRSAARAAGDAMPLLSRAKAIEVVVISDRKRKEPEIPGADFARHLARHGRKVDLKNVVADIDVPNSILSYASDCAADFIVMGGYGHSRLREFILGGATRGIMASMTVPTLMSH